VEDKGAVNHFYTVEVPGAEMDFEFFGEGHRFVVEGEFHGFRDGGVPLVELEFEFADGFGEIGEAVFGMHCC